MLIAPELLLFSLLLSLLGGLTLGGILLRRRAIFPWAAAWAVALGGAVCLLLDEIHPALEPLGHLSSALYPALFVGGALQYARRPRVHWLFGAALAIGIARAGLVAAGLREGSFLIALALNPALFLVAAWIVERHVSRYREPGLHRLIAIGFAGFAALELADALLNLWGKNADAVWPLWIGVGVMIAAVQIIAALERSGRERAGAIQDLGDNERRFREISAGAYDLIFEFDNEGSLVFASKGVETTLGLRPHEAIGQDGRDLVHPEDRGPLERRFTELNTNSHVRFPLVRVRHADGSWRSLEVTARRYERTDGDVRALLVARDVTERNQAVEALHATQERLRAVLSSMGPLRVVVVDEDGRLQSIFGPPPAREEALYGMARAEAARRSVSDFLPEQTARALIERIRHVFKTGEPCEVVESVHLPNGRFDFQASLQPVRSADGKVEAVLAVTQDVTDQLAEVAEKRRLQERLERARRLESLELLSGGIAHDFNNVLMAIRGNTEIALDGLSFDAPLRPLLGEIADACESASALTSQLLAYLGKTARAARVLDLSGLVRHAEQSLREDLAANLNLTLRTDSDCRCRGDDAALERVLTNLVANAADSIGDGPGTIEVTTGVLHLDAERLARSATSEDLSEGDFAFLEVRDDGRGIPEEHLLRLFDPFFSTGSLGRGLGLAEVFGIARAHGGTLEVESEPAAGAVFRFFVPAARASGAS